MDILSRPVLTPDRRIAYGAGPCQFGHLWLPDSHANHSVPVVAFFHGGWWKSAYDLGYAGYLCAALKRAGIATWSIEYRRVGSTGGGWPTTFQDVANGFDYLSTLARSYPLDLSRLITMGHSAGGHLAFWIAGRHHIPAGSEIELHRSELHLRGAIALAGAVDLGLTIELSGNGGFAHDRDEVYALMDGTPTSVPHRYAAGDPGALLPLEGTQILIQGTEDDQIPPELPFRFAEKSRRTGGHTTVKTIPRADHLDVVDPESLAWNTVLAEVKAMLSL